MSAEITIQSATHILSGGGLQCKEQVQGENQMQKCEIQGHEVCKYFPRRVTTKKMGREKWTNFACEPHHKMV